MSTRAEAVPDAKSVVSRVSVALAGLVTLERHGPG